MTKERISKILDAGANVLILTGGIDDMCMKYLVERGVMGVRRCRKVCSVVARTAPVAPSLSLSLSSSQLHEYSARGARAQVDLKRIAKATGATMVSSLSNLEGDETFEPAWLGHAESFAQERISDDELCILRGYSPPCSCASLASSASPLPLPLPLPFRSTRLRMRTSRCSRLCGEHCPNATSEGHPPPCRAALSKDSAIYN